MTRYFLIAGLAFALVQSAAALDYGTTARAALIYDAPSPAARKIAIAGGGLPLEVILESQSWLKVRDPNGHLGWIEKSALGKGRNVMIKAESSAIRKRPHPEADIAFHASRGVLLEVTGEPDGFGWLPVRHAGGLSGWLPAHEAWGK